MTYSIKEIYFTLQGEGVQSGRPAVFCRFSGCNLWTGLEKDRDTAVCRFCDTDFVGTDGPGGGKFATPAALAAAVAGFWVAEAEEGVPYVVCTGGEPLLQVDAALIVAFKEEGFEVGIETNGTIKVPDGLDWICVSPKADKALVQNSGNELKLVYPQEGVPPERFEGLAFDHFLLQPMDGPMRDSNTALVAEYCAENPQWRVSVQTHKLVDLP
ncbi:MAG: 7-carboxy-7-deazaguanine synthase [Rhodospirillaceae bacterium]|nr:7-carboxy-7-deazaguanine synthase [Rhodospirillaceae bacterium]